MTYPRVCLVVLDGWGLAEPGPGNAISLADTPVFDELWEQHPHTTLTTHGPAVGLPEGQMGNSEVGHLNLGAGAVVKQDLLRIDEAIEDGSFFENEALRAACQTERLHLLGLVSDGGVHSSMGHLRALIELAGREGVYDVVVHAFTDGRDTSPDSGVRPRGRGRELGRLPDRDRVRALLRHGPGQPLGPDPARLRRDRERRGGVPRGDRRGGRAAGLRARRDGRVHQADARGRARAGSARATRPSSSTSAPTGPASSTQKLGEAGLRLTTLTEYHEDWDYPVAFPPARPEVTLASTLAERGKRQLHVAETEKYAHVTYFFNGGEEDPYHGRGALARGLAARRPDLRQEARDERARGGEALVDHWRDGDFTFGIINFANPDMVGHTGVIEAAVRAVETVDECLGEVVQAVHESGGVCIVTADHGNADHMLEPDGSPNTAHSMNPVPLVITGDVGELRDGGTLADVAPTVLALLGEEQPEQMTGTSLTAR